MAINIKKIISDSLLSLIVSKSLEEITIQDLMDDTGISRQTFYNHFKDKNDLIQYIYNQRIIPDFESQDMQDFKSSLIKTCEAMKQYKNFMMQACQMSGQNCLKDYMHEHCIRFDLVWHEAMYGSPLPEALRFATIYHAFASSSMTHAWILNGMVEKSEVLASMIYEMRVLGMNALFQNGKQNPYKK